MGSCQSGPAVINNKAAFVENGEVHEHHVEFVPNSTKIEPPKEPSLLDNTQLFLCGAAARELGLEPNMDDKGDTKKEMWFGRVWELRALIAARYQAKKTWNVDQLSEERKTHLIKGFSGIKDIALLIKVQKKWGKAAAQQRINLSVLSRIKFSHPRGTLVYAHGSGGNSWDNMRICRMIARMGFLVIVPDDFAYPEWSAMGKQRHKDLQPLHKIADDVDYWADDLIYASDARGTHTYSTKADKVLADPQAACELYESCYQLRANELHYLIKNLPNWIHIQGFFLGGTSEGAMTIARFDDQRYGKAILGRFINSFSVEYCYFTPKPEAGQLGGQVTVPTLNIIGTKDQFFGPEDSVAKIVQSDASHGFGEKNLTGNAYNTLVRQGCRSALVCVMENGVHSPCNTHDNFLRDLFHTFFTRPNDIWELDNLWKVDPTLAALVQVKQQSADKVVGNYVSKVTQLFVPRMVFPQKMDLRTVHVMRTVAKKNGQMKIKLDAMKAAEDLITMKDQAEAKAMLDEVRAERKAGKALEIKHENYYGQDDHNNTAKAAPKANAT